MEPEVNALEHIAFTRPVHGAGHARWGADIAGALVAGPRRQHISLSLSQALENPIPGSFLFARIGGDLPSRHRHNVAHAVAKPDGIGYGYRAKPGRGLQVADDDRTSLRIRARCQVVGAQINPAAADHVMGHANERLPAGVQYPVKLARPIRPVAHPGIDRVIAGGRDSRRVSRRRGFGLVQQGKAIRHRPRAAKVDGRVAVKPLSRELHARGVIIQYHLIWLIANGPESDDRRAGVKSIRNEEVHLVEVPVVFIHFLADPAPGSPVVPVPSPAVAGAGEDDSNWIKDRRSTR